MEKKPLWISKSDTNHKIYHRIHDKWLIYFGNDCHRPEQHKSRLHNTIWILTSSTLCTLNQKIIIIGKCSFNKAWLWRFVPHHVITLTESTFNHIIIILSLDLNFLYIHNLYNTIVWTMDLHWRATHIYNRFVFISVWQCEATENCVLCKVSGIRNGWTWPNVWCWHSFLI